MAPYFFDWLAHPNYDEFWKEISIEEHFGEIAVPAFHAGAWYDIFLRGTLERGSKEEDLGTNRARRRLVQPVVHFLFC
jgi:predicted acyl esterase